MFNKILLLVVSASCFVNGSFVPRANAASDQIGLAVIVRNDVNQVEPRTSKILPGDDIFRDEVVQTKGDSSAKFVLKDSTNLVLGPSSTLKLDRAVFSDEKSVGDIAIKLATGSFRFITGNSAKESYVITTPIATMGVRGTTLDLRIERFQNTVVLKDGQSRVCAGGKCVELMKPGDTAVVKAYSSRVDIEMQPSSTWSFDSACAGMCGPMSFAEAQNAITTGAIGTGGAGGGGGGTAGGGGGTGLNLPSGGSNNGATTSGPSGTTNGSTGSLLSPALGAASFGRVSDF